MCRDNAAIAISPFNASPEIAQPSAHIIAHVPHGVPTSHLPQSRRPGGERLQPRPGAQTRALDKPRNAPAAQNTSPGAGALHQPSATSCSPSVFHMLTHRGRQRSNPRLPRHFPATTQSDVPSAGGSGVRAGGAHAAPQETAHGAAAESWRLQMK